MRMEVHLQQRLEQRMHLSLQMIQNLELLQLPIMDLREIVLQELEANPALEERRDVDEPETAEPTAEDNAAAEKAAEDEAARQEMLASVEDQWAESERRTRRSDGGEDAERRMEMMNNLCQETASLREHLVRQLSLLDPEPGLRPFCEHVIENIDDAGYIRSSLEEMAASLPQDLREGEPADLLVRRIERAVAIIQTMEPRGVAARSVKECLLLQLDESNPEYPLLRKLIEHHFEDVGANRLPRIVKAFMADPEILDLLGYNKEAPDPNLVLEDVKSLIGSISKLNPKPGASYSGDRVPKVFPEVVIKQVDGKYEIVLEDGWLPAISVNRNYEDLLRDKKLTEKERERIGAMARDDRYSREERELFAELARGKRIMPGDRLKIAELLKTDKPADNERGLLEEIAKEPAFSKEEREFLKRKMDAGRKLITAIEQRRGTIYRITSEILKRQLDFFGKGVEHLRPLKMQEVADAVGIHLSTVSRAIHDKWVETPRGVFPLKFFFASAAPKAEAGPFPPALGPRNLSLPGDAGAEAPDEQTRRALMEKIREIVDAEDRKNPLSDLEIVKRLKDQHRVTAARRTVAKYREEMGIPSSRLRKQY